MEPARSWRRPTWTAHTYGYDAAGQLVSADHPDGSGVSDEAYSYGPGGDRIAWSGHDAGEVLLDDAGRLVQDARFTYDVDAAGQRVRRTSRTTGEGEGYVWDALGRLVAIHHDDGTETEMAYDALDRRIWLETPSQTYRFGYGPWGRVRAVYDETNALSRWYAIDAAGMVLARWDEGTQTREDAVRDHLGTVRAWVDDQGQVTRVERDSFGVPVAPTGDLEPHALTWHTEDPSGLVYAEARYLDPRTGRFLTEDPIPSPLLTAYSANNPIAMWDPDGRFAIGDYGKILSATAVGTAGAKAVTGVGLRCWLYQAASTLQISRALVPAVCAVPAVVLPNPHVPEPDGAPQEEPEPEPDPEDPPPGPLPEPCIEVPTGYHRGGTAGANTLLSHACSDEYPPNRYWNPVLQAPGKGSDCNLTHPKSGRSNNYDAISVGYPNVWEVKVWDWTNASKYPPYLKPIITARHVAEAANEASLAHLCGYQFTYAIGDLQMYLDWRAPLLQVGVDDVQYADSCPPVP